LSGERLLGGTLVDWAERTPEAVAVRAGDHALTYAELERASRALALRLGAAGVAPGDRVGLVLPKSPDAVVACYGVLRAGGVYVPIDQQSPPARQLDHLTDASVRGVIGERRALEALADTAGWGGKGLGFVLGRDPPRVGQARFDWDFGAHPAGGNLPRLDPERAACILYTSGSTGRPKGVTITHRGAQAFVDWAVRTLGLTAEDRLANHAQLSFDLSIFDLFAAGTSGAAVTLVPPEMMVKPRRVWDLIDSAGITTWYSVPSAITLLVGEAGVDARPPRALRRVLFAGEAFPIPQLRRAMQAWPKARFFNLFGPTETNVCLWHELDALPSSDVRSIPIGVPCDHLEVRLMTEQGALASAGEEGEIAVAGPSVLAGYWGQPELTAQAFWPRDTLPGVGPLYRTGDRARRDAQGKFWFLGRRDRLVKRRGYRIELGEVEASLARLPGVREAAVVGDAGGDAGCSLRAIVVPKPGAELDLLDVKLKLAESLPRYMLPDKLEFRQQLPRTATGKIDWQSLK
jgi:amino acid adenylation domain-containing protein